MRGILASPGIVPLFTGCGRSLVAPPSLLGMTDPLGGLLRPCGLAPLRLGAFALLSASSSGWGSTSSCGGRLRCEAGKARACSTAATSGLGLGTHLALAAGRFAHRVLCGVSNGSTERPRA